MNYATKKNGPQTCINHTTFAAHLLYTLVYFFDCQGQWLILLKAIKFASYFALVCVHRVNSNGFQQYWPNTAHCAFILNVR